MDLAVLGQGFALGLSIAAAVGPISLLVIRRTLAEGRVVGLVSGLGVATADATDGGIAAFGLTAITDLLVGGERILGLLDAGLMTLGVRAGSASWWLLLTTAVARLRSRITPGLLHETNLGSGLLIGAFGLVATGLAVRG